MAKALTVKALEAIKPSEVRKEIGDAGAPGLFLIVQTSGKQSWSFRYRSPVDGKPRKFTIGPVEAYPLAKARDEAFALRRKVQTGVDPSDEKKAAKAKAADTSQDVGVLLDEFLAAYVKETRVTTSTSAKQQIESDIRPAWVGRRIETITRHDVAVITDKVVARGSTISANRIFALVRRFLNWCVARKVIEANPVAGTKRPVAKEPTRDRVLTDDEVRWLWAAADLSGNFGACVKILLLTGQRRAEVGGMSRRELVADGEATVWQIPPERAKNGVANLVPMSSLSLEILSSVPRIDKSDIVFTIDGKVPSSGWSKSKSLFDARMLAAAQKEAQEAGADPAAVVVEPWGLHDLRRTCASGMARLRQPPHVIEAILNHKSGEISRLARVYNRYGYLDEKTASLAVWEAHVSRVVNGPIDNVLPMRRA